MEHCPDGNDRPPDSEQRRAPRTAVHADAILRRDGSNNFRVSIFDVSPAGCRVETIERLDVGEGVWIRFDGLEPLHARVRWVEGPIAGVEFEKTIHGAVFELLVGRLG